MTVRRVSRIAVFTLSIPVALAGTSCANQNLGQVQDQGTDLASGAHGQCSNFSAFSGQLVVGDPPMTDPELPPLLPGNKLPVERALPTLDTIRIDKDSSGNNTVHYALTGDGAVGWTARFVESPFLQNANDIAPITGVCVLQLDFTGVDYYEQSVDKTQSVRTPALGDASAIVEVLSYPSSNFLVQSFIGLRAENPDVTVNSTNSETGEIVATVTLR